MDCKEMIVEKENSGWLGSHSVAYTNPNFLFLKSGHILFRKPDNSPARKYQMFLVDREAKIKQLTKGVEEVTDVINFNSRSTMQWFQSLISCSQNAKLKMPLFGENIVSESLTNIRPKFGH